METLTGAEILVRALKAAGVECVFMKEHTELEAIEEAIATEGSVKLIKPVSETSSVPMADGYTRYSGKPAVAITAGGGHALNQAVGIGSAWADKSPVVTIGVSRKRVPVNSPVFDRVNWNQAAAFETITRWTDGIERWDEIPATVLRGVRESLSGRCGPVYIDVSEEFLKKREEFDEQNAAWLHKKPIYAQHHSPPKGDPELVKKAFDLLNNADKPLIFAGGGVVRSEAADDINELAEKLNAPITTTMGGMGAANYDSPVFMGAASYLSGEAFHTAIREADVVLAVGCCFSGLDGFGLPPLWSSKIKFVQVNIDPEDIAINPPAAVPIVADAKEALKSMLDMAAGARPGPDRSAWVAKLKRLNREHLDRIEEESARDWNLIHPATVPPILYDIAGDTDVAMVLDGGNTALWAGMLLPVPGPRRGFFPMGMGTLGLGIPMAIGIKAAAGDKPVHIFSGDGAFLYNVHELETIRKYNMPIVSVVMNDSAWNMIRAGQAMAGEVYGTDLPSQDYAKVAQSYGIDGVRITKKEDVGPEFKKAFESGKPALLDIVTDPDTLPDSLISFARVEFEGAKVPPGKLIKGLRKSKMKLDVRAWNLTKFIAKTR